MSKEKECKCCHEWWYGSDAKEDLCPNCYDYFRQLKQKLKEKDNLIEFGGEEIRKRNKRIDEIVERDKKLFDDKNKELEKLKQQLAEKDTRIAELEDKDWYEACIKQLEEQNDRLIDKIEEKDKEIAYLKEIRILKDNSNMSTKINGVDFSDEQILTLQVLDILKRYNQKQLAIQELEKTLNFIENVFDKALKNCSLNNGYYDQILDFIDQQIKELKGE